MVNVANINRLIERIREDKGVHMKMTRFAQYLNKEVVFEDYEPCNTAFCLCGHANMIAMQDAGENPTSVENFRDRIFDRHAGASFLGIREDDIFPLFEMAATYRRRGYGLLAFDTLPEADRANAAIRVLEILRNTGEVDWETALEGKVTE